MARSRRCGPAGAVRTARPSSASRRRGGRSSSRPARRRRARLGEVEHVAGQLSSGPAARPKDPRVAHPLPVGLPTRAVNGHDDELVFRPLRITLVHEGPPEAAARHHREPVERDHVGDAPAAGWALGHLPADVHLRYSARDDRRHGRHGSGQIAAGRSVCAEAGHTTATHVRRPGPAAVAASYP